MTSNEIRKTFIDFFASKGHTIVPSSSMIVKNDPTLLFTNAGMNQFKDIFLGNIQKPYTRATDSQKCLRVSGKHNDLEEVGHDTYHHTMFEMLGNWSFGDYFKKEAIAYSWELLTKVYKIDEKNLYVTVFGGDEKDGTKKDEEAYNYWKQWISEDRILLGNKKDNFWEMGEVGPCGSCSEIHIDLRSEEEKKEISGKELVNKDNPQVIEIWNLVFMQYNRLADGSLVPLKEKNIDTGMGFERLCMVIEGKKSNYDTDVFQPLIQEIAKEAKEEYGKDEKKDIAMRVIADHERAVSFAIADGLLPSNSKAGYVIRRILRRAVRYGYTFLGFKEPFMYSLVKTLVNQMGGQFKELKQNQDLIEKVIKEEENTFLRTLSNGIIKFEKYTQDNKGKEIDGAFAFELFDTYGFPIDLTELMAKEKGLKVDMVSFDKYLQEQKQRSKNAASVKSDDWVVVDDDNVEEEFVGYDVMETKAKIIRYRKIETKGNTLYQIVLNKTPFYGEMGGQIGDSGVLENETEKISIIDTKRENNLIIHISKTLPKYVDKEFNAKVDREKRLSIERNHTATHLLHNALRNVLGLHVEQKGSYVDDKRLRFDFAHHSKMSKEEIREVERQVNSMIREDFVADDKRDVPIDKAKEMGAMALFSEKYGDKVRVIRFGQSIELCGGTHVKSTGTIGGVKIINESAIAAGVRRIEAVTGVEYENYINKTIDVLDNINALFVAAPNLLNSIKKTIEENNELKKEVEEFIKKENEKVFKDIQAKKQIINNVNYYECRLPLNSDSMKDIAFHFRGVDNNFLFVGASSINDKASLTIMISDNIVEEKNVDCGKVIREAAKNIKGGGGGQKYFATSGGKDASGIDKAIEEIKKNILK